MEGWSKEIMKDKSKKEQVKNINELSQILKFGLEKRSAHRLPQNKKKDKSKKERVKSIKVSAAFSNFEIWGSKSYINPGALARGLTENNNIPQPF